MSIPVRGDHSYTTWRVRRSKLSSMKGESSCQKTAHCSPLSSHLSILYCNARSIISKFDELCALIEVHSPRIVCIVETWLSYEVSDSEFTLPGSALIETTMVVGCLSMFIPTLQPMCISRGPKDLDILIISVNGSVYKFCIGLFYRPTNSSNQVFSNFYSIP